MKFFAFFAIACVSIATAAPTDGLNKGDIVPGKFFVEMKDSVSRDSNKLASILSRFRSSKDSPAKIVDTLSIGDYNTFVVEGSEQMQSYLNNHPEVANVHPNRVITIDAAQENAPWGLTRLSRRNPSPTSPYEYPESAGEGVDVYVIDTGVMIEHPEFEGRAFWGDSFVENSTMVDGQGHGTHVAGTIASLSYGVAKKANIIAVRVLDSRGAGTTYSVVQGMNWASRQARRSGRKAVANMSLGGGADAVLNAAASAMVQDGVFLVVAAGNDNKDACGYSPAGVDDVLTVGSIDVSDKRSLFSNHGPCVNVFAPGSRILSTWNNGKSTTLDGTSMASPHVAGVMALLLADKPFPDVKSGFEYLKTIASLNRLRGTRNATNAIAYNGLVAGVESNPPAVPEPLVCAVWQCWFNPECDTCKGFLAPLQ